MATSWVNNPNCSFSALTNQQIFSTSGPKVGSTKYHEVPAVLSSTVSDSHSSSSSQFGTVSAELTITSRTWAQQPPPPMVEPFRSCVMLMSPLLRVCFHSLSSFYPTGLDTLTLISTDGPLFSLSNSLKKHPIIMSSVNTVSLCMVTSASKQANEYLVLASRDELLFLLPKLPD